MLSDTNLRHMLSDINLRPMLTDSNLRYTTNDLDEVNTTIYQPQRSDYHRGQRPR
jgi:hypothetical protein